MAAEIESSGGHVSKYSCDIADSSACERFIAEVLAEHGHVDILINNAGRSIRRAIENTYSRLHDYERLMGINYFAAVRSSRISRARRAFHGDQYAPRAYADGGTHEDV